MAAEAPTPRRAELLTIAGRLFALHGYHGTSVRDIAGDANLRAATLYTHFDSKAAIFRQLTEPYFTDMVAALESIADETAPPTERLERMVRAAVDVGLHHRDAFVALSNGWESLVATPGLESLIHHRNAASRQWRRVIDAAMAAGNIEPGFDPADVEWLLYSAVTGMVDRRYQALTRSGSRPPIDLLLHVLRSGLWHPAAPSRKRRASGPTGGN